MESNLKLSPPWITFVHEVEALFAEDLEVKVRYNSNENLLQLFVDNTDKAAALTKLLPEKKEFGNVVLNIEVVPANNDEKSMADLFLQAFYGKWCRHLIHHLESSAMLCSIKKSCSSITTRWMISMETSPCCSRISRKMCLGQIPACSIARTHLRS